MLHIARRPHRAEDAQEHELWSAGKGLASVIERILESSCEVLLHEVELGDEEVC